MSAPGAIALATTPETVARCYSVVRELRPHLADEAAFVAQVQRQREAGYRLAYLEAGGEVRAVAGFRVQEKLSAGRFLYVDDLVTRAEDRSLAYGGSLLDWLADRVRGRKAARRWNWIPECSATPPTGSICARGWTSRATISRRNCPLCGIRRPAFPGRELSRGNGRKIPV